MFSSIILRSSPYSGLDELVAAVGFRDQVSRLERLVVLVVERGMLKETSVYDPDTIQPHEVIERYGERKFPEPLTSSLRHAPCHGQLAVD